MRYRYSLFFSGSPHSVGRSLTKRGALGEAKDLAKIFGKPVLVYDHHEVREAGVFYAGNVRATWIARVEG